MTQLSDEQESELLQWIEQERRTGCVVGKDMIAWYAGCLFCRDEFNGGEKSNTTETAVDDKTIDASVSNSPHSRPPPVLASEYVDAFLERHPDLAETLKPPAHPVHPSDRPPGDENGAERASRTKVINDKRRPDSSHEDRASSRVPGPYPQGDIVHNFFSRYIVRNNEDNTVTKFTTASDGLSTKDEPNEAVAMRFIKEHTTIPVPAVISAAYDRITMEYVEGQTLKQAWPVLLPEQRTTVMAELRGYLAQLRALDGAKIQARRGDGVPPRIGRINGEGALLINVFPRIGGPFDTIEEFHQWLTRPMNGREVQSVYWNTIAQTLADGKHSIVFSHGDLAARNIIVRDGHIVALVDWENAGWYPEYWDYVYALRGLDSFDWEAWGSFIRPLFEKSYDMEFIAIGFISSLS